MLDLKILECLGKGLWYLVFIPLKTLLYTWTTKPLVKLAIKKIRESREREKASEQVKQQQHAQEEKSVSQSNSPILRYQSFREQINEASVRSSQKRKQSVAKTTLVRQHTL